MSNNVKINYLEFPAKDLNATKIFFNKVFNWTFTDYGPEYTAFSNASAGMDGGFYQADLVASTQLGSALVVFYSKEISTTQKLIEEAGGKIVKPIFQFPGGERFHFTEPSGNEFAVWSDQ